MRLNPFRLRRGRIYEGERLSLIEPDVFKAKLNSSLSAIASQVQRLALKYKELELRGKQYFDRCVESLTIGDEAHARLYADEIAEIKRLAKIILHSQLILEQVKIRLESILELSDVIGLVTSLKEMIGKVVGEVSKIAPEAASHLEELSKEIDEFINTSGMSSIEVPRETPELSDEASRIFEDAKQIVAMKLKESFPDVPVLNDVESLVYSYLTSLNPDYGFDLRECCNQLGLSEEQVEEALQGLQRKGIIEVAEQS